MNFKIGDQVIYNDQLEINPASGKIGRIIGLYASTANVKFKDTDYIVHTNIKNLKITQDVDVSNLTETNMTTELSKREKLILAFADTPMAKAFTNNRNSIIFTKTTIKIYVERATLYADSILSLDNPHPIPVLVEDNYVIKLHGLILYKNSSLLMSDDDGSFVVINASDIDNYFNLKIWEVILYHPEQRKFYTVTYLNDIPEPT